MPYIPHTRSDVELMLEAIGVDDIEALFDEIPGELSEDRSSALSSGLSELEMMLRMQERASRDEGNLCFLGAGCYDHHIPAAVWDIASRGEFMTAYTPYQAEASQGTLQLIYEYQSMMTQLMAMDVSNASVYDGASGLAEAILMAVRSNKSNKSGKVLYAEALNPVYLSATNTIISSQGIELERLPIESNGVLAINKKADQAPAAVVIQQPNFFGRLERVDEITNWAHSQGALVIAVVNPMSLGVLKPPGLWGDDGVDIACGDGQPLGIPMSSGGPSFGFICCKSKFVRQIPGRVVGKTEDLDGQPGYALTLQAREQHIRRGKATSNICTNQGLLVTAGTIYLSLLGAKGLRETAIKSHQNTNYLREKLLQLPGIEDEYPGPVFNEFVVRLPVDADELVALMTEQNILAGLPIESAADEGGVVRNKLLVAVTEKRTKLEMDRYLDVFSNVLGELST